MIFPKTCIFCGKIRKTVKKNEQRFVQAERKSFEVNNNKYGNWLNDEKMPRKILNLFFKAKKKILDKELERNSRRNEPKGAHGSKLAQREKSVFTSF